MTAASMFIPRLRRWRIVRICACLALGTSTTIPVLHGTQVYGLKYMLNYSWMKWYMLELAIYAGGAGIYAVCLHVCNPTTLTGLIRSTSVVSQSRTFRTWYVRPLGKLTSDLPCCCSVCNVHTCALSNRCIHSTSYTRPVCYPGGNVNKVEFMQQATTWGWNFNPYLSNW
jgi:hypothetical protein